MKTKKYTLYSQPIAYRGLGWQGAYRTQQDSIDHDYLSNQFEKGFYFKLVDNKTKEIVMTNAKRGKYGLDLLK